MKDLTKNMPKQEEQKEGEEAEEDDDADEVIDIEAEGIKMDIYEVVDDQQAQADGGEAG